MKNDSSNRPRALVLTSTFPRWENDPEPAFIFELSRRLCPFFDVTVLSPRTPGANKKEDMAGMHIIRFPYFLNRWEKLAMHGGGILNNLKTNKLNYLLVPLFLIGQLWALVHLLRKDQFALIHAHWLIPQGLIAAIAMIFARRRPPLVCTSHGGDLFALRGVILQRIKKWVLDRSQALTMVSRALQSHVIDMGIAPDKVKVISMGVDLKHRFTTNATVKRSSDDLLFVGRLVEVKGVRVLLEAMPALLAANPNIRLSVAGAGPLEMELKALAGQLNLSDKIDFLGMVSQEKLPALYQRAALAVFPFIITKSGVQEGFGLVVIEAMGCGCPVIAGDLPAIHDSITHGENGLLVPPGNPELLAETILKALSDSDLRYRLAGEAHKRVVEQFDWEIIAEKYAKLYETLIREG